LATIAGILPIIGKIWSGYPIDEIIVHVLCILIGASAAYYAQPFVQGNSDVILVVATVFTVFAGFLIAIIAVLGDPSQVPGDDWKVVETRRHSVESRTIRHIWLLMTYLVTLAILFISVILENVPDYLVLHGIKRWIEFAYLFVGISSFCLSSALPFALLRLQMQRLEETERRRTRQGITPS
jgi:hypothetical protein